MFYILFSISIILSLVCLFFVLRLRTNIENAAEEYIEKNAEKFRGPQGPAGPQGPVGEKGAPGKKGNPGHEPFLELDDEGYLWIDDRKQKRCLVGKEGSVVVNMSDGELTKDLILAKLNEGDEIRFNGRVVSSGGFYDLDDEAESLVKKL